MSWLDRRVGQHCYRGRAVANPWQDEPTVTKVTVGYGYDCHQIIPYRFTYQLMSIDFHRYRCLTATVKVVSPERLTDSSTIAVSW